MDITKKKILLVEDDIALAAVYRSRLELEGFEIHEVNNGEDAEQLGVDDYLVKSQVVIGDVVARVKHHLALDGQLS